MTPVRSFKRHWLSTTAVALALPIAIGWGGAAVALPSGFSLVGGSVTSPSVLGSAMTVTQTSSRAVIDWNSFNIAHGESVTFSQPSSSAIAFNVLPAGVQTTISGSLTANGGVWIMSPGGVIFGAGAVVSTGSFVASTGNFNATSVTQALTANTIEIFPQSTVGVGSISVEPTASITANAGFITLQAPTIDQEGALTASDAVVLNALEGVQLAISPSASGVSLESETPIFTNGGSSNITAAGTISGAWVELDAFNNSTATPGVSGIINLTGHITATAVSPSSGDGVDLLANFGSTAPSDLVTTISASGGQITSAGTINASAGTLSLGAWTTTAGGAGLITASAGPGGITSSQPLAADGGADVDLTAVGPISITAPVASTSSVTLSGDTIALGAGAAISAYDNINLNAPDGVAADPSSSLTAVDSLGNPGQVDIQVGSTSGPANLIAGQINAGGVTLSTTAGLTRPAGGISSGPGDITVGGAITTGAAGSLSINSYLGVAINAPVTAQGTTGVTLNTNQGGSGGDYGFGTKGSLSFTGTPADNQSLTIDGTGYALIYSLSDLLNINTNLSGDYALANSLDMANLSGAANPQAVFFTASPIANTSTPEGGEFTGVFAGLGHIIANLNINQTVTGPGYFSNGEVGLFGVVGSGGTVRDLSLTNVNVTGGDGMDVGGAVGYLSGTLKNVSVAGVVTGGAGGAYQGYGGLVGTEGGGGLIIGSHSAAQVTGGGDASVGGLVGSLNSGGTIESSYATGAVTTGDSGGYGAAGGLVGSTYAYPYQAGLTPNTISDSYATGAVTGGAGTQVGGFIGQAVATNITTSYATGSVTQSASNGYQNQAGGFVGFLGGDSTISQSYASGAVTSTGVAGATNAVGGFVGAMQDNATISDSYALGAVTSSNDSYVGGFAGVLSANLNGPGTPSIERVYATGAVTDSTPTYLTGGLVGDLTAGSISNSFWDSGTTGVAVAIGQNTVGAQTDLTAVTSATAYLSSTYATAFDMTGVWVVLNGETRPMLRSEYSTTISNAHQLELMSLNLGASYSLASNIDASETASASGVWNPANAFVPVGVTAAPFTGTFDGRGYTISNLTVVGAAGTQQSWGAQDTLGAAGLFGVEGASGVIQNVALANATVRGGGGMDVGALVGIAEGEVLDSSASGLVVTGTSTLSSPATAGGLVGGATGEIVGSTSSATVQGGSAYLGGLAGWLAPGGSVSTSIATGAVTGGDGLGGGQNVAAGGLIGFAGSPTGGALASISGSSASGSVTAGADAIAGGLVGEIDGADVITSYSIGAVTAGSTGGAASLVGGFVGDITNGQIASSYATGAVSTTAATSGAVGDAVGGFAGEIGAGGIVTTSYATGAASGEAAGIAGVAGGPTTDAGGFVGLIAVGGSATNDFSEADVTLAAGAPGAARSSTGGFAGDVEGSASDIMVTGITSDAVNTPGGLFGTVGAAGVVKDGYWDAGISPGLTAVGVNNGTASGLASVGGAGPSPYQTASYAGLDFTNTWYLIPGETRPILRADYSTTITNDIQLELMSLNLGATYQLATDIEASDTTSVQGVWNPANGFVPVGGSVTAPFTGVFNGNGHTITGLTIIDTTATPAALPSGAVTNGAVGLFGYSSGQISSVNLGNISVTAGDGMSAGALVGNQLSGAITSVTSDGEVTTGSNAIFANANGAPIEASAGGLVGVASGALAQSSSYASVSGGEAHVGGLVGQLQGGSILDSYAGGSATVGAYAGVETPTVGGLVGTAEAGPTGIDPTIQGSFATGGVFAGSAAQAGGFIGSGSAVTISTSYATGGVTLNGANANAEDLVGGFAGSLQNSIVSQSFSSGPVNVTVNGEISYVGGFVGNLNGGSITDAYSQSPINAADTQAVGGFAGEDNGGAITRVYASGAVQTSGGASAGLVGELITGTLSDSFWDEGATNQTTGYNLSGGSATNVTGVGGATGIDPYAASTYAPFDFGATWSTPSQGMYPELYGVSHVLRISPESTSTLYADFPVYVVDEYGFQPLEGPSVVNGLTGGATNTVLSSSGHYDVTIYGSAYPIVFSATSATSPNGSGAYQFVDVAGNLTVTPRTLSASLINVDKVYDATTNANLTASNYQLSGAVSGDVVGVGTAPANGVYATDNVGTGIGVSVTGITLSGADAINYTVNSSITADPIGVITAAPLTISAVTDSKVYDGTTSSTGAPFVVSGLQGADTVVNLSQSFDSKNAGARTLNVNAGYVIDDGNNGGNYTVTLDSATGTITPAQLTLSAVTDSKVYDGTTNDGLTPTETGLVGGDTIADLSQSFDSKNAGSRTLSVNPGYVVDDGNNGGNYTVNLVSAFGTITPKPLTVDLVGGVFKIYDGNTIAPVTASNFKLIGVIDGDTVALATPTTGVYDTPFQGTGKVVTVGDFTLFGADAEDYTVSGSASAPIGTICLAGCLLPPVYGNLLSIPGLLGQLQFGFIFDFPDGGDFPVTPDDGSSRKGDRFPVTGAGNRDLWTGPQINLDAATGATP